jgi:hypothetical protein
MLVVLDEATHVWAALHSFEGGHPPHVPLQPSSPHVLPVQLGLQLTALPPPDAVPDEPIVEPPPDAAPDDPLVEPPLDVAPDDPLVEPPTDEPPVPEALPL